MFKWLSRETSSKGSKIRLANKKPRNSFFLWEFYSNGFTSQRVFLELVLPLFISILGIGIALLGNSTNTEILLNIERMNGQIFDVIAIQTGFNITCLALFSSFNRDVLRKSFSKVHEEKKEAAIKQLLISFAYCIYIQTIILIAGTVFNVIVSDLFNIQMLKQLNDSIQKVIVVTIFIIWLGLIIHSFMVFLRNVSLIYKFVLVIIQKDNN